MALLRFYGYCCYPVFFHLMYIFYCISYCFYIPYILYGTVTNPASQLQHTNRVLLTYCHRATEQPHRAENTRGSTESGSTWSPGQVILQSSQYFHCEGSTGIFPFLFHQRVRAICDCPRPAPPPPPRPVCVFA